MILFRLLSVLAALLRSDRLSLDALIGVEASVKRLRANTAAPSNAALGSGIKQMGENDYEVPKPEIDKTLSNLNDEP